MAYKKTNDLIMQIMFSIFCISLMLFSSGCSTKKEESSITKKLICANDTATCPDGSKVYRNPESLCEFNSCIVRPIEDSKLATSTVVSGLPQAIKDIQARVATVKSYEYLDSQTNHMVLVKGSKVVILTSNPNEFMYNKKKFNAIYLDNFAKTAYAACIPGSQDRNTFLCADTKDSYMVRSYAEYSYDNPYNYVLNLTNATVLGDKSCDKMTCDEIAYFADGTQYKMTVRKVYSMPHKILQMNAAGEIVKTVTFSGPIFNNLKDDEMVIPIYYRKLE